MRYHDIFLAHAAFYRYEKRAKHYDFFLKKKNEALWQSQYLPPPEIDKLFSFIRRWDHHFRGDEKIFRILYGEIFPVLASFENIDFHKMDISDLKMRSTISSLFDRVASLSEDGRYQSTDASKILHVIKPRLFVMWDRSIRKGILGDERINNGECYANLFLPKMKDELGDLLNMAKSEENYSDIEIIELVEKICDGNTIAKLIDEHNYMNYTMPTEYVHYRKVMEPHLRKLNGISLKKGMSEWIKLIKMKPMPDERINKIKYISLLNKAQEFKLINGKERRKYAEKWDKNEEAHEYLMKEIERIIHG